MSFWKRMRCNHYWSEGHFSELTSGQYLQYDCLKCGKIKLSKRAPVSWVE